MLDLDDLAQIQLVDRSGMLARAGARQERWTLVAEKALSLGDQHNDDRATVEAPEISVHLGGILRALTHNVSTVHSDTLFRVLQRDGTPGIDGHPADLYLFLLLVLDPDRTEPPEIGAQSAEILARCAPGVGVAENPAKRLAQGLADGLPLFWASEALLGVAEDWRNRRLLYAESHGSILSATEMRYLQVMARFPRYWPRSTRYLRLGWQAEVIPEWQSRFELLAQRRGISADSILAPEDSLERAALFLFEMGEWVALYGAVLNGVDPRDRVPLDFLGE